MGGKASGIERARRAYMKQSAREIILKMHYFYEAEEELEAEWKEFQRWRRRKKKRSTENPDREAIVRLLDKADPEALHLIWIAARNLTRKGVKPND